MLDPVGCPHRGNSSGVAQSNAVSPTANPRSAPTSSSRSRAGRRVRRTGVAQRGRNQTAGPRSLWIGSSEPARRLPIGPNLFDGRRSWACRQPNHLGRRPLGSGRRWPDSLHRIPSGRVSSPKSRQFGRAAEGAGNRTPPRRPRCGGRCPVRRQPRSEILGHGRCWRSCLGAGRLRHGLVVGCGCRCLRSQPCHCERRRHCRGHGLLRRFGANRPRPPDPGFGRCRGQQPKHPAWCCRRGRSMRNPDPGRYHCRGRSMRNSGPDRYHCRAPDSRRGGWRRPAGRFAVLSTQPLSSRSAASTAQYVQNKTTEVARLSRATSVESVSGDVLLSHAVARAVPSALRGLASGFGMGPGVSLSLWSPKLYGDIWLHRLPRGSGNRTSGTAQWTRALASFRRQKCVVANPRPISTSQLQALPLFHFWPINPVVYAGALLHEGWESSS